MLGLGTVLLAAFGATQSVAVDDVHESFGSRLLGLHLEAPAKAAADEINSSALSSKKSDDSQGSSKKKKSSKLSESSGDSKKKKKKSKKSDDDDDNGSNNLSSGDSKKKKDKSKGDKGSNSLSSASGDSKKKSDKSKGKKSNLSADDKKKKKDKKSDDNSELSDDKDAKKDSSKKKGKKSGKGSSLTASSSGLVPEASGSKLSGAKDKKSDLKTDAEAAESPSLNLFNGLVEDRKKSSALAASEKDEAGAARLKGAAGDAENVPADVAALKDVSALAAAALEEKNSALKENASELSSSSKDKEKGKGKDKKKKKSKESKKDDDDDDDDEDGDDSKLRKSSLTKSLDAESAKSQLVAPEEGLSMLEGSGRDDAGVGFAEGTDAATVASRIKN